MKYSFLQIVHTLLYVSLFAIYSTFILRKLLERLNEMLIIRYRGCWVFTIRAEGVEWLLGFEYQLQYGSDS